jgi:hypothetical protein
MKRENVKLTLLHARLARTDESRSAVLLVGIHELLYAIAEQLGCFDEDDDEEEDDELDKR